MHFLFGISQVVPKGIHVTDVTNASRTQLFNLKTLRWDSAAVSRV